MTTPNDISPRFAELLTDKDDVLVSEVSESLFYEFDWSDPDALPDLDSPLRTAGDVAEADFLIGSGGFPDLVLTDRIAVFESLPRSFNEVGAESAAQALQAFVSALPRPLLECTPGLRHTLIESSNIPGGPGDNWLGYFTQEPEPWRLLAKYIRRHSMIFAVQFSNTEPPPAEPTPPDPAVAQRRAVVAKYNASCEEVHRKLSAHGAACPRCDLRHKEFRCVIPSDSERQAYFICRHCGCTFQRDDVSNELNS